MSKIERTGWRDEGLSLRHRQWGVDCPAVDIDFLLLEYDKGLPMAIIEYKMQQSKESSFEHPSYKALRVLCDKSAMPFFICRYSFDYSTMEVIPVNEYAKKWLNQKTTMSEKDYVTMLYSIRQRKAPDDLFPLPQISAITSPLISYTFLDILVKCHIADTNDVNYTEVLRLLRQSQGYDRYTIHFDTSASEKIFASRGTMQYSSKLLHDIAKVVGYGNIAHWQRVVINKTLA